VSPKALYTRVANSSLDSQQRILKGGCCPLSGIRLDDPKYAVLCRTSRSKLDEIFVSNCWYVLQSAFNV